MPPLDEESALFMPVTDPRILLTKATEIMRQPDRIIAADPAVQMAVGKIGQAEMAWSADGQSADLQVPSCRPSRH